MLCSTTQSCCDQSSLPVLADSATRRISCPFISASAYKPTLEHQRRTKKEGAGQTRFVLARRAADFPFQLALGLQFAGDQAIEGARPDRWAVRRGGRTIVGWLAKAFPGSSTMKTWSPSLLMVP